VRWWAHQDLNLEPTDYESAALTVELWALAGIVWPTCRKLKGRRFFSRKQRTVIPDSKSCSASRFKAQCGLPDIARCEQMIKRSRILVAVLASAALIAGVIAAQEQVKREPLKFNLYCTGGDCPFLKGPPQTSGMRGGSVKLNPGESVGWHSTSANEEALVILQGSGVVNIEGQATVAISERMLAYIPSTTRHNVTNNGSKVLEYVWVVAPIAPTK
jgi:mannose-6-phosphate isomerase-like protein (cupin superfamily)